MEKKLEEFDDAIVAWFKSLRDKNLSVSNSMVNRKVLELAEQLDFADFKENNEFHKGYVASLVRAQVLSTEYAHT